MTEWISVIVVTIIIFVGLGIFYKALKEPIDLVIYWLYRLFNSIYLSIRKLFIKASSKGYETTEEIVYGQ